MKGTPDISAENPVVARPYAVGLFDVLGFKNKFEKLGLKEITARYAALIDIVMQRDKNLEEMKTFFGFLKEGPYWCRDGEIVVMTQVHAAYASDTFLVWANYTWTDLHQTPKEELDALAKDRKHDWLFRPVPCDAFVDVCNELMCRSLQVGLPLRGALAVGDAVMDRPRNIFLGQPIIDANILEHGQIFIGAGMCSSFIDQTIPARFRLTYNKQLKNPSMPGASDLILDWPRHWRKTRKVDVREAIQSMNTEDGFADYYQNTLDTIEHSAKYAKEIEPGIACPIRSNYEQFSYEREDIAGYVLPVRKVTAEEKAKLEAPGN